MSQINDGGPAFPVPPQISHMRHFKEEDESAGLTSTTDLLYDVDPSEAESRGMSLRDYFAAHAPSYPFKLPDIFPGKDTNPDQKIAVEVAAWRYAYADAMLAQRHKGEST